MLRKSRMVNAGIQLNGISVATPKLTAEAATDPKMRDGFTDPW